MKILSGIYLLLAGFLFAQSSFAQSAEISGTILSNNSESNIRTGGQNILITLTEDRWTAGIGEDNAVTTALLNSFSGSAGEWAGVMSLTDYTMVSLVDDSTLNIDLPAVPTYNITSDETVNLIIDPSTLLNSTVPLTASNSFVIVHQEPFFTIGGTVNDGTPDTEIDVRLGNSTIELKLTHATWRSDVGIADNASTLGVINGFIGSQSWDTIKYYLDYTHLERINDSIVVISVPPADGYYIPVDETVSVTIPAVSVEDYDADLSGPVFTIQNVNESLAISGTLAEGTTNTEADVRSGGGTVIFQLSGDEFKPQVGSDPAVTQEFINGIANIQGDAWDTYVTPVLNIDHVTQNSKNQVTVLLPPIPDFDISSDEIIRAVVPVSSLKKSLNPIPGTPDISIVTTVASITAGGNISAGNNNTEADIRQGLCTITLTVANDQWETGVGDANNLTEALVNGITGSSSWNNFVIPAILGSDQGATNVSVNANVVTIDIPAVPSYDIAGEDVININVPANSLRFTSGGTIPSSNTLSLQSITGRASLNDPGLIELNLEGSTVTLTLSDDSFTSTNPSSSAFSINGTNAVSVSSLNYISDTQVELILSRDEDFDSDIQFSVTVDESVINGTESLVTNEITVTSVIEPIVSDIAVTPGIYGIGETVRVELTVNDDGGDPYSYASGTVAGNNLTDLQRQSSVLYYAFFTVPEGGQDYPVPAGLAVNNLRLDQGSVQGEVYNGTIIQNDYQIDANRPVINYLQAPDGVKKIGDNLDIIVSADGNGYDAVPGETSVNGYPLTDSRISFHELGSGVYILRYVIEEGDPDVASGDLVARLVLSDQAGNQSAVASTLTNNVVEVDANPPVINSLSVDNNVYTIGDVITMTILADGSSYAASNDSHINGVPLSSPYLSFTNLGGNNYQLQYTIRSTDGEVNPGELEASVILVDDAGNNSQPFSDINDNTLSIYTALPSATLIGNQEICEDDSARLIVNLTGRGPWRFYLNDGSVTTEYADINYTPYEFYVKPSSTSLFVIDSVIDVNGIKNNGSGTVTVTVREKTDVEIIGLNSSYSIEDDPVPLQANISGGIFSGPGVVSSSNLFDPHIADTINSPHNILYTLVNSFGCVSVDTALVFVLGAEGDIYIPKPLYCDYEDPFTITAINTAGTVGEFTLYNSAEEEMPSAMTDNRNNTATIDPALTGPGTFRVRYDYSQDGAKLTIWEPFIVERVQDPKIITIDQSSYCQNEPAFHLEGNIESGVFSGPGVSGNAADGFIFNPSSAYIGNNKITYTNTTENGCRSSVSETVRINYVPEVNFKVNDVCLSPSDSIVFTNTTVNKYLVEEWSWNFGDVNSGAANYSSKESDYHFYTQSGSRLVLLIGETYEGCVDSLEKFVEFGHKPYGDFVWDSDCLQEGDSIQFVYDPKDVPVTEYEWQSVSPEGDVTEKSGSPDVYFTFSDTAEYRVILNTRTNIGCSDSIVHEIRLKPTIVLNENPYYETFEDGNGKWTPELMNAARYNSWTYGLVDFKGLNEEASKGWYTLLPEDEIPEQSYVISPCFDLRGLERPMIKLDFLQSLDMNREGVVLQASADHGKSWKNVGTLQDGINWFNSYQISNKPGDQDVGWTGKQPFNPDENWVEARHHLDRELTQNPILRFRFAFASAHDSKEAREGFAFDNIWIGNRSRNVLLEHFTNVSDPDARQTNQLVNSIYRNNFSDLVKLEYHTEFPGEDPMNKHNKAVPATRSLFYGISNVPYSVLDGGGNGNMRYDYVLSELDPVDINLQSLIDPKFDIDLTTYEHSDYVDVDVTITALDTLDPQERILQVAVFEKLIDDIETSNGEKAFLNVVKAMLPNAAGTAIFDGWSAGESKSFSFEWFYNNVFDPEMIRVAVFVQNDLTKEVYQAESNDTVNTGTSVKPSRQIQENRLLVYPNPASETINLYLENADNEIQQLEVCDQLGRVVYSKPWIKGESLKTINVSEWNKGVYFVRLTDKNRLLKAVEKIIVTGR